MRLIECLNYGECLDRVVRANGRDLECAGCPQYVTPMREEESFLETKTGRVDIMKQEEELKKVCTKCGKEKSVNEFHKFKAWKHGVKSICRACCAEYSSEYREKKRRQKQPEKVPEVNTPALYPVDEAPDRASILAEEHWSYVCRLLEMHGHEQLEEIAFHYKTAMIHGYKHGMQDAKEGR